MNKAVLAIDATTLLLRSVNRRSYESYFRPIFRPFWNIYILVSTSCRCVLQGIGIEYFWQSKNALLAGNNKSILRDALTALFTLRKTCYYVVRRILW